MTDDFVPFITERLAEMARKHNLVLVTNDHVDVLTGMADSTITVTAIDRSRCSWTARRTSGSWSFALAKGEGYEHNIGSRDLSFFVKTELITSPQIHISLGFTVFSMALFLLTFWDSEGPESLVLVAIQIIAFFAVNPFLIGLTDWRNIVREEAEALMHSSVQSMLALKTIVTLSLMTVVITAAWGCLVAVLDTSVTNDPAMWVAMLCDLASFTLPFVFLGLYSRLPLQFVQTLAGIPFLFMIFFSSTFSPGAGVEGLKALRYLFPRFYLWCRLPDVKGTRGLTCRERAHHVHDPERLPGAVPLPRLAAVRCHGPSACGQGAAQARGDRSAAVPAEAELYKNLGVEQAQMRGSKPV